MSASPAEIPGSEGAMSPSQLFVINLCASTSPMALAQPNAPELKRFTFFVSRQRDDGRDRFRLHMGYFASQQEAEQMLGLVRDVYPAAWTGPAPASGVPRRNRVAVTPVAAAPAVSKPAPAEPVVETEVAAAEVPAPAAAATVAPQPLPDLLDAMSNVRDVLANLDGAPSARMQSADDVEKSSLDEGDVLRVLEASAKSVSESGRFLTQPQANVRLITPQDTQTLADMQNDADNNAPPCFAVQLVWSASPIDVTRLPHLAIFDAYTLYNVEGNRDGRKWYGVRLGFFSEQSAANQVASYVRSDYRAVAIVPVTVKESEGAGGGAATPKLAAVKSAPKVAVAKPAAKPLARPEPTGEPLEGFQLLADDRPAPLKRDLDDRPAVKIPPTVPVARPVAGSAAKAAAKPAARTPGKPAGKPVGKRVVVRKRPAPRPGAPNPLESTLEILGASTLTLDESRTIINDSAVRKPVDRRQGGRFSRLLSRLSGN